jgi:hypothetical protein
VANESHCVQNLGIGLVIGATSALITDAVLRNALAAAQSPTGSSLTPWWVVGHVSERAVWVVLGLLVWVLAPVIVRFAGEVRPASDEASRTKAFTAVGHLMLVLPPLWAGATLLVFAAQVTLAGNWSLDIHTLTSSSLYRNLLLGYLPWAGGGLVLLAVSRHAGG